jgi:hypothetical protein
LSWTQKGLLLGIAAIGGVIVMSRTGTTKAGLSPGKSAMKGAVYASQVPVYPGAKLRDTGGGNYYNEIGGPVTFTSTSWFFEIKDPVAKVADFYASHLPPGARPAEAEEGSISFEWTPPGSLEGEEVSVTVREGELQIGETLKAGRTAATAEAANR